MSRKHYIYGNKGNLWTNNAHAAFIGHSTTVCGVPMLATNWCAIHNVQEVQCKECKSKIDEHGES